MEVRSCSGCLGDLQGDGGCYGDEGVGEKMMSLMEGIK